MFVCKNRTVDEVQLMCLFSHESFLRKISATCFGSRHASLVHYDVSKRPAKPIYLLDLLGIPTITLSCKCIIAAHDPTPTRLQSMEARANKTRESIRGCCTRLCPSVPPLNIPTNAKEGALTNAK